MTSKVHPYVDSMGEVLVGPFEGGNFRYLRFQGVHADPPGRAAWTWESYAKGDDWEQMPRRKFVAFLKLYGVTDAGLQGLEVAT